MSTRSKYPVNYNPIVFKPLMPLGDSCCPLTTSTATRIVAEAAWEEIESGKQPQQVTPFGRLIEPGSSIAQKRARGSDFIEDMRQQEGILILTDFVFDPLDPVRA